MSRSRLGLWPILHPENLRAAEAPNHHRTHMLAPLSPHLTTAILGPDKGVQPAGGVITWSWTATGDGGGDPTVAAMVRVYRPVTTWRPGPP